MGLVQYTDLPLEMYKQLQREYSKHGCFIPRQFRKELCREMLRILNYKLLKRDFEDLRRLKQLHAKEEGFTAEEDIEYLELNYRYPGALLVE